MDLMDLAGPDRKSLPHDRLYDAIVDALGGPDAFRDIVPFDTDVLLAKYGRDRNFNQDDKIKPYLTVWDAAAGFKLARRPIQPPSYEPQDGPMWRLLRAHGVTWSTCSQNVCLLKRAAVRILMADGLVPPGPAGPD